MQPMEGVKNLSQKAKTAKFASSSWLKSNQVIRMIMISIVFLVIFIAKISIGEGSWYKVPQNLQNESVQVHIDNGIVQGTELETSTGFKYFSFRGIPFAASPVDDLRFKPPQEVPDWEDVLDATEDAPVCLQVDAGTVGSEDCLFLNVYTQSILSVRNKETVISELNLKPVMVWIYGGAFVSGHSKSTLYGPDYLLQRDVVVVTFNYRLGVFGFLNTEDLKSPGNYGIKDQIAALRWVQTNIAHFGGDPSNVTIFGESAGAASVSYLLLTTKAAGLFHRAISQSGSALCPWALQRNPKQVAFQIGTSLGILTLSSQYLLDQLRKVKAETLLLASTSAAILHLFSPLNGLAYSPSIEVQHDDAVLTDGSHELFRRGFFNRVPYIIGFNSEESAILQEMLDYLRLYLVSFDLLPMNLVPDDMNIPKLSLDYVETGLKIKFFYFGLLSSVARRKDILEFLSDSQFVKPIRETVKQMSKYTNVYFYEFSYEGALGIKGVSELRLLGGTERSLQGVGHAEELWYLFKRQNLESDSDEDTKNSNILLTLWTNFAKFSTPTPFIDPILSNISWPASSQSNHYTYLDIGSPLQLYHKPHNEPMKFWEDLYGKHGHPPHDTY